MKNLKKIIKSFDMSDYSILTDSGFEKLNKLHKTVPYEVYHLKLSNGKELKCADNHVVFQFENDELTEVFVKDLTKDSLIVSNNKITNSLSKSELISLTDLRYKENMYDFELSESANKRYYTNDILSHNTAIIEGLATLIYEEESPLPLLDKKIYSLNLSLIVAGTKYRGQFEERMKIILSELKNNPNVILFIDELHTIVGAGNSTGSLDASNILKPALARGEIQIIGATTLDEYRENIEKDGALTRRFQEILVEEPTLPETIIILNKIKENYEAYHNVIYSDEIINEIAKLSDRYISGRAMPDKAIDVLDEVGASTNVIMGYPEEITNIKLKIKELNEKKLKIITEQRYEEAALIRDEEDTLKHNLNKKTKLWNDKNKNNPTKITLDMVAASMSIITGIPLNKLTVSENNTLKNLELDLKKIIIGQDEAINKVSKAIKRSRLGIKNKKSPIASFLFLGNSGVGKTFLSKVLADKVFGDSDALITINMGEYMEKHAMSKMIGAPPGYVGYGEGGKLTEPVRKKPYCVILFDEIEKAHPDMFNLLLQLLDEGSLTDSNGRKVDFKNTLIIMTSNIGSMEVSKFGESIGYSSQNSRIIDAQKRAKNIIKKALKNKFRPEFINRIDDMIIFNSLTTENILEIVNNELNLVKEHINELGYELDVTKSARKFIAKEGYDKEFGARPLTRAIQKYVEDVIADEIMNGNLNNETNKIKINYTLNNGIKAIIN